MLDLESYLHKGRMTDQGDSTALGFCQGFHKPGHIFEHCLLCIYKLGWSTSAGVLATFISPQLEQLVFNLLLFVVDPGSQSPP